MFKDGRGHFMKKVSAKNREIIREWLKKNKNPTIKECCDSLGLNYRTVRSHVDAIERGE